MTAYAHSLVSLSLSLFPQINLATDLGLIVFCWGDDNNSQDTIKMLKSLGIHGIIYDKMDVLSTKEVKVSVDGHNNSIIIYVV